MLSYPILTVGLILFIFHLTSGDLRLLAYRPLTLFLSVVVLVHGILPLLQLATGFQRYQATYASNTHLLAGFAVLLYVTPCVLMYRLREGSHLRRLPRYDVARPRMLSNSGKHVIFLVLLVPSVIASLFVVRNVLAIGVSEFMSDRINYSAGRGYLGLTANMLSVGYLAFLVRRLRGGRPFLGSRHKGWLLLSFLTLFFAFTGSRNSIFITLGSALLCYLLLVCAKPVRPRILHVAVVLAVAGGFSYLGNLRGEVAAGRSSGLGSGELLVSGLNGAFGNHENLLWLIENGSRHDEQWGRTFLAGIVNVVPRNLWPDKPLGAGPVLKNFIHPGSYELGTRGASSLTTGIVTESIMNYGLLGLPLIGLLHGWLLALTAGMVSRCRGVLDTVIAVMICFAVAFASVYSEFLGLFSRLLFTITPVWLLFQFYEKRPRRSACGRFSRPLRRAQFRVHQAS